MEFVFRPSIPDLAPEAQAELAEDITSIEKVQNNQTGAVGTLAGWTERATSKQGQMVLQGEGRGKISSPPSVKDFGYQKPP